MNIAEHLRNVFLIGGPRAAIEFDGSTLSWDAWRQATVRLDAVLSEAGVDTDDLIGLLGRNRLEQVSGFIAALAGGRGRVSSTRCGRPR